MLNQQSNKNMLTVIRRIGTTTLGFAMIAVMAIAKPSPKKAYICYSERSNAYYFSKSCPGLQHCKHGILVVTKDEAINTYGRRASQICATKYKTT